MSNYKYNNDYNNDYNNYYNNNNYNYNLNNEYNYGQGYTNSGYNNFDENYYYGNDVNYSVKLITSEPKKKNPFLTLFIIIAILGIIAGIIFAVINKEQILSKINNTDDSRLASEKENNSQNEKNNIALTQTEEEKVEKRLLPQAISNPQQKVDAIYDSNKKIAFLTFDDGPSEVTKELLDVLEEENVKVTFFVLGRYVQNNPEIVKKAYDAGHYIANHGYTHNYASIYKSTLDLYKDYLKGEQAIKEVLGNEYNSYLFRFPGGSVGGKYHQVKQNAAKYLNEKGIAHIDWNALTSDSAGAKTVESEIQEFEKTRKPLGKPLVILQHDMGTKNLTPEVTKKVIQTLKAEGYKFHNFYDIFKNDESLDNNIQENQGNQSEQSNQDNQNNQEDQDLNTTQQQTNNINNDNEINTDLETNNINSTNNTNNINNSNINTMRSLTRIN